jgi:hypothetical protein
VHQRYGIHPGQADRDAAQEALPLALARPKAGCDSAALPQQTGLTDEAHQAASPVTVLYSAALRCIMIAALLLRAGAPLSL